MTEDAQPAFQIPEPTVLRGYHIWTELLSEKQLAPSQSRITLERTKMFYESLAEPQARLGVISS